MNKRYVTIVSDGDGKASYHSSWKSACETYGWEHIPRVPNNHKGFKIVKAPLDVSIDCLDLIEFITRDKTSQSYHKEDSEYLFEICGYDTQYDILCDYETKTEGACSVGTDRGIEEIHGSYDYLVLSAVLKVELITDDGPKQIEIDDWTEQHILSTLNFNETLD